MTTTFELCTVPTADGNYPWLVTIAFEGNVLARKWFRVKHEAEDYCKRLNERMDKCDFTT